MDCLMQLRDNRCPVCRTQPILNPKAVRVKPVVVATGVIREDPSELRRKICKTFALQWMSSVALTAVLASTVTLCLANVWGVYTAVGVSAIFSFIVAPAYMCAAVAY